MKMILKESTNVMPRIKYNSLSNGLLERYILSHLLVVFFVLHWNIAFIQGTAIFELAKRNLTQISISNFPFAIFNIINKFHIVPPLRTKDLYHFLHMI